MHFEAGTLRNKMENKVVNKFEELFSQYEFSWRFKKCTTSLSISIFKSGSKIDI